MKTNNEFSKKLKDKIITGSMLEVALYSLNKRAKNWRDKKNELYENNKAAKAYNRYYIFDKYNNIDKYKALEQLYYSYKDYLLCTFLKPECIHRLKKRFVEYDQLPTEENYLYFLFYKTENFSFHSPIEYAEIQGLSLEIIELDSLETYGKEVIELVSVQFCKKLIDLVKAGTYTYE